MFSDRSGLCSRSDDRDLFSFLNYLKDMMVDKATLGIYLDDNEEYSYHWEWCLLNLDLNESLDLEQFEREQRKFVYYGHSESENIGYQGEYHSNLIMFHCVDLMIPKEKHTMVIDFINQFPTRVYSGNKSKISSILIAEYPYTGHHINNTTIFRFKIYPQGLVLNIIEHPDELIKHHDGLVKRPEGLVKYPERPLKQFVRVLLKGILSIPVQHLQLWIHDGNSYTESEETFLLVEDTAIRDAIREKRKTCLDVQRVFPYKDNCLLENKFHRLIILGLSDTKSSIQSFFLRDLYDPRLLMLINQFTR
jgi:hypothetical protein